MITKVFVLAAIEDMKLLMEAAFLCLHKPLKMKDAKSGTGRPIPALNAQLGGILTLLQEFVFKLVTSVKLILLMVSVIIVTKALI